MKNALCSFSSFCSFFSLVISIPTLICAIKAILVANKIAFMQQWNSLITEYRSKEFGESVKAIVDFWIDDCNQKKECVQSAYIRRVNQDKKNVKKGTSNIKETLSFHRRTLLQFYWELQLCLDKKIRIKKTIKDYFNENEINLIAIVYEMSKVDAENCFRNLTPLNCTFSIEEDCFPKNNNQKYSWQEQLCNLHKRFKKIFRKKNF